MPIDGDHTPSASEVQALTLELEAYRSRALALEHKLFELRALLQSGKGFSQIFQVEDLLQAFMAVCRERCDAVSSAVLLEDDLDPDTRQFRVRAYHNIPDRYRALDGVEKSCLSFASRRPWPQYVLKQGDVMGVRQMEGLFTRVQKWDRR